MTPPLTMNGEPLTHEEAVRLLDVPSHQYRDPHTGRNLPEALAALRRTRWWPKATLAERAERELRLTRRYEERGKLAAHEPRSPHYLRDIAHRTAAARLSREIEAGTIGGIQHARRWSEEYHLLRWDPDVIALHDAAFA